MLEDGRISKVSWDGFSPALVSRGIYGREEISARKVSQTSCLPGMNAYEFVGYEVAEGLRQKGILALGLSEGLGAVSMDQHYFNRIVLRHSNNVRVSELPGLRPYGTVVDIFGMLPTDDLMEELRDRMELSSDRGVVYVFPSDISIPSLRFSP